MNLPGSIRAFVSVNLSEDVRLYLAEVQRELKGAGGGVGVRWAAPEQIHLTLKFLGNIASASLPDLEAALIRARAGAASFELRAEGVGAFPDLHRPRVLWVGLTGELEALRALQEKVLRETIAWGGPEERAFHPHLTIARIKDPRASDVADVIARMKSLAARQRGNWQISEFHLMRSELSSAGSRYTSLATIPLRLTA